MGQTFSSSDIATIALLIVLEGVLSIDNALVLGLLARRLPKHQQKRALTYGLVGAFVFRFIAIFMASLLLQWRIVKILGGGYLLWVALKYFWSERDKNKDNITLGPDGTPVLSNDSNGQPPLVKTAGFWSTVFVIELTDIAFAVDSILAALALVGSAPAGHIGPHPKLWVVVTGGMLGVILMRFAAVVFIKLLDRFPRFETSAYLLVAVIGAKLAIDWALNSPEHPHRADFHDTSSPAFWIFWIVMLVCLCSGFLPQKRRAEQAQRS